MKSKNFTTKRLIEVSVVKKTRYIWLGTSFSRNRIWNKMIRTRTYLFWEFAMIRSIKQEWNFLGFQVVLTIQVANLWIKPWWRIKIGDVRFCVPEIWEEPKVVPVFGCFGQLGLQWGEQGWRIFNSSSKKSNEPPTDTLEEEAEPFLPEKNWLWRIRYV